MGCISSKKISTKTAEDNTTQSSHNKQTKSIDYYVFLKYKPQKVIMKKLKKFRPGLNVVDEVSFENEKSLN